MNGTDVATLPCGSELQQLAVICSFICVCNESPLKRKGRNLRQLCVDVGLGLYGDCVPDSPFIPEVPYIVNPVTQQAVPIFDTVDEPQKGKWKAHVAAARVAAALSGGTDEEQEKMVDTTLDLAAKMAMDKKKATLAAAGRIRRPDVIILKDPLSGSLHPDNIKKVIEIKFPGDRYRGKQKDDYKILAGNDPNKLKTLSPEADSCNCKGKDQHLEGADPAVQPAQAYEDMIQGYYDKAKPKNIPQLKTPRALPGSSSKKNGNTLAESLGAAIGASLLLRYCPALRYMPSGVLRGVGVPVGTQEIPES